jgi:hypothetical protein
MDLRTTGMIRKACKWFLDLLQNLIVVGVIQYMAQKSGNVWIKALSMISYIALYGYCASYVQMWSARVDIGKSPAVRVAVFISVSVMLAAVLIGVSIATTRVVDEIAKAQMR